MSRDPKARCVHFSVVSSSTSLDDILEAIPVPPDETHRKGRISPGSILRRPARENAWRLKEEGDCATDVSALLNAMSVRIKAIREELLAINKPGLSMLLSIVQYASPDDPTGPGFVVEPDLMRLLAELGAPVDADLYIERPPARLPPSRTTRTRLFATSEKLPSERSACVGTCTSSEIRIRGVGLRRGCPGVLRSTGRGKGVWNEYAHDRRREGTASSVLLLCPRHCGDSRLCHPRTFG
jgi:uncharacterized protein DUF4279